MTTPTGEADAPCTRVTGQVLPHQAPGERSPAGADAPGARHAPTGPGAGRGKRSPTGRALPDGMRSAAAPTGSPTASAMVRVADTGAASASGAPLPHAEGALRGETEQAAGTAGFSEHASSSGHAPSGGQTEGRPAAARSRARTGAGREHAAARVALPGAEGAAARGAATRGATVRHAAGSERAGPLLLGVRHHGPGSARAVRAALDATLPRVVLIEGPAEADALVALAADPDMRPPVALLAHVVDEPGRSAFWPFAEFSPEWVALRWALAHDVPVRFIDLPAALTLAWHDPAEAGTADRPDHAAGDPPGISATEPAPWQAGDGAGHGAGDGEGEPVRPDDERAERAAGTAGERPATAVGTPGPDPATGGHTAGYGSPAGGAPAAGTPPEDADRAAGGLAPREHRGPNAAGQAAGHEDPPGPRPTATADPALRIDPLAVLAEAAGYDDPERWWEDVVEHRGAAGAAIAPFEALAEAMGALREVYGPGGPRRDLVREAHMRLQVRTARRQFGDAVAVVCGAWHVPALRQRSTVAADRALLKGLPKVKADMTWVPWTHRRLSKESGYGAGIDSPGWYGHLFQSPDRPLERWLTKVAGLLREEDRIVSSAHVIEAVRLAGALAALRGRPLPGLSETTDAVRAVMCDGSDIPLALIRDRLVVGDVLGEVPEAAPAVPLQRDLNRLQRTLRLKPEALERELDLDLRRDTDAARSRLLHRLRLLGVDWGEPASSARASTGTFRETWRLRWEPELAVRVAEAGVWGTTVSAAAAAKAHAATVAAQTLADVTALAERCLLADLPDALPTVMRTLADRAALDADVGHLAQALPALVRSLRYGDVRGTDTRALGEVAAGLAERIFVGLPPACAAVDADAAAELRRHVDAVHGAVGLLVEAAETEAEDQRGAAEGTAAARGARAGAAPGAGRGQGGSEPAGRPAAPGDTSGQGSDGGGSGAGHAGVRGAVARGRHGTGGGMRGRWHGVLRALADRESVPGVLRGRSARLLLDEGDATQEESARRMGLALSPGTEPAGAAAWIDGFVGGGSGSGMLLVHDERLLALVDGWLTTVPDDAFTDVLPLLRRTFAAYEPGVRRTLGELVLRGPAGASAAVATGSALPGFAPQLDTARADAVLPVLSLLLGLPGSSLDGAGRAEAADAVDRPERPDGRNGRDGAEGTDAPDAPGGPDGAGRAAAAGGGAAGVPAGAGASADPAPAGADGGSRTAVTWTVYDATGVAE